MSKVTPQRIIDKVVDETVDTIIDTIDEVLVDTCMSMETMKSQTINSLTRKKSYSLQ